MGKDHLAPTELFSHGEDADYFHVPDPSDLRQGMHIYIPQFYKAEP